MASSTWLGCGTPAWHAEPVEHSIPAASSRYSSESPSQPGTSRWTLPGSRSVTTPGVQGPPTVMSRPRPQRALDEGVAQTRQPGRLLGQLADRLLDGDGEPADRRDVEGPAADLRSWPPPWDRGTSWCCRLTTSAPTPIGPPSLCAVSEARSTPDAATSTGSGRPPGPRRCGPGRRGRGPPRRCPGCPGRCRPRCWPTSPTPARPTRGPRPAPYGRPRGRSGPRCRPRAR